MIAATEDKGKLAYKATEDIADVAVGDIKVADRLRKTLGDLSSLEGSMKQLGLLEPIGITRDKQLVFGLRRLECAKKLGWDTIRAVIIDDADSLRLKLVELAENLKRKGMSWWEVAEARVQLHELCQREYGVAEAGRPRKKEQTTELGSLQGEEPTGKLFAGRIISGWSQKDSARLLGVAESTLSEDRLVEAFRDYPTVKEKPTRKEALLELDKVQHPEKYRMGEAAKPVKHYDDRVKTRLNLARHYPEQNFLLKQILRNKKPYLRTKEDIDKFWQVAMNPTRYFKEGDVPKDPFTVFVRLFYLYDGPFMGWRPELPYWIKLRLESIAEQKYPDMDANSLLTKIIGDWTCGVQVEKGVEVTNEETVKRAKVELLRKWCVAKEEWAKYLAVEEKEEP